MRPGPPVTVHAIQDRRGKGTPRPWYVRWRVGDRRHTATFSTRAAADDYRSRLLIASRDGERFDPIMGEPVSWRTTGLQVWEWAAAWVVEEAPTWSPRSRRSVAEGLARGVPALVRPQAPPAPDGLREALKASYALGGPSLPAEYERWLRRWSLPVQEVDREVCRRLDELLGRRLGGGALAAATAGRHRKNVRALLRAAVDRGILDGDPWPPMSRNRARRKAHRNGSGAIDLSTLPSLAQVRTALEAIATHQPASRGYQALTALVFYGGLRPSEAHALDASDLELPGAGWGTVRVRRATTDAGAAWTGEDEEEGDPKEHSSRDVPIPPEAVALLRDYLDGRTSGPLVTTRHGNRPTYSNWSRAWFRARRAAGGTWRLYDLRHTAATVWLSSGVPVGEVARRLGHSPAVLLTTYAGVLEGDAEVANARIEAVLV